MSAAIKPLSLAEWKAPYWSVSVTERRERCKHAERIWEVARRVIDPLLDDLVQVAVMMPCGDERAALNRFINELDEQLIAETTWPALPAS